MFALKRGVKMKKAQTWSLDVMIAILIFIVVVISFFYIINSSSQQKDTEKLKEEAESIPERIISSESEDNETAVEEKIVSDEKLMELVEKSKTKEGYEELKRELGIEGEVHIHFEDEDGNIIYINDTSPGIGSREVNITDE
jgi:biopolymer transport protein ExbD